MISEPLQAPQDEIDKFKFIKSERRRTYAAMVSLLDKSVGNVVSELKTNGMLENSVIVFFSDNGGPHRGASKDTASNYPLRGVRTVSYSQCSPAALITLPPLLK